MANAAAFSQEESRRMRSPALGINGGQHRRTNHSTERFEIERSASLNTLYEMTLERGATAIFLPHEKGRASGGARRTVCCVSQNLRPHHGAESILQHRFISKLVTSIHGRNPAYLRANRCVANKSGMFRLCLVTTTETQLTSRRLASVKTAGRTRTA